MTVALNRVYAEPSPQDGARVLVDRLWPRGLKKSDAALDAWLKDLAPSNELRKWFHAHPPQWSKFREKYLKELTTEAANTALQQLHHHSTSDHLSNSCTSDHLSNSCTSDHLSNSCTSDHLS